MNCVHGLYLTGRLLLIQQARRSISDEPSLVASLGDNGSKAADDNVEKVRTRDLNMHFAL